jgi:hypothetical protein
VIKRSGDWLFDSRPGGWLLCILAGLLCAALALGSLVIVVQNADLIAVFFEALRENL